MANFRDYITRNLEISGDLLGELISIAARGGKRSALYNDDIVTNAEYFLTNFYDNAFGLPLTFADCHDDMSDVEDIIARALENVSDYKDIAQWIEAAKEVAEHEEEFEQAFGGCPNTMGALREGALLLETLEDIEAAKTYVARASIHHPLSFPSNLVKARSAVVEGNWAGVGTFSGNTAQFIVGAVQSKEGITF